MVVKIFKPRLYKTQKCFCIPNAAQYTPRTRFSACELIVCKSCRFVLCGYITQNQIIGVLNLVIRNECAYLGTPLEEMLLIMDACTQVVVVSPLKKDDLGDSHFIICRNINLTSILSMSSQRITVMRRLNTTVLCIFSFCDYSTRQS